MVETISREELRGKVERGDDFALVETLPEEYYRHSHLPGAVNLPTEEVEERAGEVLPREDAEIVVYCMSAI